MLDAVGLDGKIVSVFLFFKNTSMFVCNAGCTGDLSLLLFLFDISSY